MRREG